MGGQPRPINHGTYGGYQTHKRRGEEACEPCREASAAWRREYMKRTPKAASYNKRTNQAWEAAQKRLRARHRDEFEALLQEERRERGLPSSRS